MTEQEKKKAYDFKELGKSVLNEVKPSFRSFLKDIGKRTNGTFWEWMTESAKISKTGVDDLASLGYSKLKDELDQIIDRA